MVPEVDLGTFAPAHADGAQVIDVREPWVTQRGNREEAALLEVLAIDTPTLGDRSYLAHDGTVAVVVDPQRDIDRVLELAASRGVAITHIFETHLHNDYVTGGLALAAATGAAYHVNAADPVAFDRVPVSDGDVIAVSPSLRVRVLATPGHTFTHLSYVLEADGRLPSVFTGGSLLHGSTGRPDLLGPASTGTLAHAQYASAHRLADQLPAETGIYPTHGFGSFCSATQAGSEHSTIGRERRVNPALTLGEQEYVTGLLAGLDAYPAYYAHMGPANAAGPDGPDLSGPARADAAELRRRLAAGEWVVDLRTRTAFAAGHLAGTWADSHLSGAVHIPLHDLLTRLDDVPSGEVWVHCHGGYRATVAASILDAAGRTVVAIDDEYDNAARAGLPVTSGETPGRAA